VPTTHERTSVLDFSTGMLCGLVLNGHYTLSDQRLYAVHEGFIRAFQLVDTELGKDQMGFWTCIDRLHGTSLTIDGVMQWWLDSGLSTKDAPGFIYRFRVGTLGAVEKLDSILGGRDLYQRAAKVLIDFLRSDESFTYHD